MIELLANVCNKREQAAYCAKCGLPFISRNKFKGIWTQLCDACNGKQQARQEVNRRNAVQHYRTWKGKQKK